MYFDTHAHYDDGAFDKDRDGVLAAMQPSGVKLIIDPGCDGASSLAAVKLSESYPFIYAAAGWHPEELDSLDESSLGLIRELAMKPKTVAIGEIGLDYYWDASRKEEQKALFTAQIELALELKKPVIVHDREAHGDSLETVKRYPELRGVFHCFSGSPEMAGELLKMGWYLGFDGPVTYKNARKQLEVLKICPLDRILIETDSPYMTPVPHRGERNDSRMLEFIAAAIAGVKDIPAEKVAQITADNGKKLFGIEESP